MLRIIELRKALGKLQKDVAHDLRLSRTTYNQYETGKRTPDNETLVKIANYYGVSTDYLLGNADDPTPPDAKKEAPSTFEECTEPGKTDIARKPPNVG